MEEIRKAGLAVETAACRATHQDAADVPVKTVYAAWTPTAATTLGMTCVSTNAPMIVEGAQEEDSAKGEEAQRTVVRLQMSRDAMGAHVRIVSATRTHSAA